MKIFGIYLSRVDWKSAADTNMKAIAYRESIWIADMQKMLKRVHLAENGLIHIRQQLMDLNGTAEYTDMADGNRLYYKVQNKEVNA